MKLIVVEKLRLPSGMSNSPRATTATHTCCDSVIALLCEQGRCSMHEKRDHIWWDEARSAKFFIVEME